jgi:hypothetical protein
MNQSLRKFYLLLLPLFILLLHLPFVSANVKPVSNNVAININDSANKESTLSSEALYGNMNLSAMGLSEQAFHYAVKGYHYLQSLGKLDNNILSIVDFSLPASRKRLFVIDMENAKLLFNTYVAHGRNSGKEYATQFSNRPESFQSSLGFYITKGTYSGAHGFSLQLEGEEKGINDNAFSRAIVMHSADYVNKKLIKSQGYMGRSLGCPALPKAVYKPIIETIKNGSCLFMYSPHSNYVSKSQLLQLASS